LEARASVCLGHGLSLGSAFLNTRFCQEPVLAKALTRFRIPWRWNGGPAVLQSRARDETGYVQPTRAQLIADRGMKTIYHFNGIASWDVSGKGELTHVYT
jgi:sulfane dehydrogenase subunit SoxC